MCLHFVICFLFFRRCDRAPADTSRLCSCHFPEGKERGPLCFLNKDGTICTDHKIPRYRLPRPVKKDVCAIEPISPDDIPLVESVYGVERFLTSDSTPEDSICEVESFITNYIPPVESVDVVSPVLTKICPSVATQTYSRVSYERMEKIFLEVKLKDVKEELRLLKQRLAYSQSRYTASRLSNEVVKMETGLPDKDCFNKIVECATSLEDSVTYRAGWKVQSLSTEDQVFLTFMKLKHNYKDFHLAAIFNCSISIIRNAVLTWTDILQGLLQDDYTTAPRGSKAQKKLKTHPLNTNL